MALPNPSRSHDPGEAKGRGKGKARVEPRRTTLRRGRQNKTAATPTATTATTATTVAAATPAATATLYSRRLEQRSLNYYPSEQRIMVFDIFNSRCLHLHLKYKLDANTLKPNHWYGQVTIGSQSFSSQVPMRDKQSAKAAAIEVATENMPELRLPRDSDAELNNYQVLLERYAKRHGQQPPWFKPTISGIALVDDPSKLITPKGEECEISLFKVEVRIEDRPEEGFISGEFSDQGTALQQAFHLALEWLRSQGKLEDDPVLRQNPVLEKHWYRDLHDRLVETAAHQATTRQ